METFLGGVGVLIVGGIGWLSYYKREWYIANLQPGLINGTLVAFVVGATSWFLGNAVAGITETGAIKPEALSEVKAMFDHLQHNAEQIILIAITSGFLLFMIRVVPPHDSKE